MSFLPSMKAFGTEASEKPAAREMELVFGAHQVTGGGLRQSLAAPRFSSVSVREEQAGWEGGRCLASRRAEWREDCVKAEAGVEATQVELRGGLGSISGGKAGSSWGRGATIHRKVEGPELGGATLSPAALPRL